MDISNPNSALDALIALDLTPYWDSTSTKAFFRIRKGPGYRKQKNRGWYDGLIEALGLYTKEDVKIVQERLKRMRRLAKVGDTR